MHRTCDCIQTVILNLNKKYLCYIILPSITNPLYKPWQVLRRQQVSMMRQWCILYLQAIYKQFTSATGLHVVVIQLYFLLHRFSLTDSQEWLWIMREETLIPRIVYDIHCVIKRIKQLKIKTLQNRYHGTKLA